MSTPPRDRTSNPFSTRFVRPGALPFQFPAGQTAASLAARLRQLNWRAQIIGPHGTGKSTLLAALLPAVRAAGQEVRSIGLHDGQHSLPAEFLHAPSRGQLLVIDGFEQLGWRARWRLRVFCRRSQCGLLVTTHRSVGLPTLFATQVDSQLIEQLAAQLQQSLPPEQRVVTAADAAAALAAHQGDVRESLFALYDLFEQRRAN